MAVGSRGETWWANGQMCKKAKRLRQIFGDPPDRSLADPCFVLLSPQRPQRLETDDWPGWMTRGGKPVWMKLPRPSGLRKVTRCAPDGRPSADGEFLRIDP